MSHPSLLFLDGHFETIPDFDVHTFLPCLPVLQAQGMRISARAARSLAIWPKSALNTGFEPKKFDKITSVDSDTMLIDDPDLNEISDFSKNTEAKKACIGKPIVGQTEREEVL